MSTKASRTLNRDSIIRDSWLKHGCPERMTIRVRGTGESILVQDGFIIPAETGHGPRQDTVLNPRCCRPDGVSTGEKLVRRVAQPVTDNRQSCAVCHEEFASKRNDAKYCSARCRQAASRRQRDECRRRKADELLARVFVGGAGQAA